MSETVQDQMYIHVGSRIGAFDWYRKWWPCMTLNGVMAIILRYAPNSSATLGANYVNGWS